MKLSKRVEDLPPYLFVEISRKIAEKKAMGEEIISFAIGDPDVPTPDHVIDSLCEASRDPANHHYPDNMAGKVELRMAIADWYSKRFGVTLDIETEVLPLIGAKEGIAHMAMCFIDPGDTALVPDPGYPVYSLGTTISGGHPYHIPLKAENGFLPDYDSIPAEQAQKAKILWINYPNNPTGAVAGIDFFERTVEFARKYDIAVCHDAPYTEVAFDGYRPPSFLQASGAKEVGVEFHSFSKSYNMPGWRIGMVVGNAKMVGALKTMKSNIDSGIPPAIQLAAIDALTGPQDCIAEHNAIYERRRDLIIDVLRSKDLEVETPKGGLYLWVRIPPGYNSAEFAEDMLDQVGIVVTPGIGYGKSGEGYVRLSLTVPDVLLVKGLSRLAAWRDSKNRFKSKKV